MGWLLKGRKNIETGKRDVAEKGSRLFVYQPREKRIFRRKK